MVKLVSRMCCGYIYSTLYVYINIMGVFKYEFTVLINKCITELNLFIYLFIYLLFHSFIHSFIYLFTYSFCL